jgi:hypothetical protein
MKFSTYCVITIVCLLFVATSEVEGGRRVTRSRQIAVESQVVTAPEVVTEAPGVNFLPEIRFFGRGRLIRQSRRANVNTFRAREFTRVVTKGIEPVQDNLVIPAAPTKAAKP